MFSVPIELDKPRNLRFNLRAIADLEAVTGKPVGDITRDLRMIGVTAIVACLHAGLAHEDKALTRNLVIRILEDYLDRPGSEGIRPVLKAIDDALSGSGLLKRIGDEEPEGNVQPEQATTT